VALWGCSQGPPRILPPAIDAAAAAAGAMEKYDTNHDGLIKGEELDKAPPLKAALPQFDANKDSAISADEIRDRIKQWQESRVGLMSFTCTVKLNGAPLEGCTVTMVPEEYLGKEIKPASGVTDAQGVTALSVPRSNPPKPTEPPGVACGLYRLQFSKVVGGKEIIPEKYNKNTTIGEEVAQGCRLLLLGRIEYDLKTDK
jgi:hypothetical protein